MGLLRVVGCALCLGGVMMAQTAPRRPRTPSGPATSGCPAPGSIPLAIDSSATSGDFVELRRMDCAGGCPAYTLRLYGDGRVNWTGEKNVVVLGHMTAGVDATGAKALIQEVVSRGFWGLCTSYASGGAEAASSVTTVSVGGKARTVVDHGSLAPAWLRTVNAEVDELTDSHRWRHGEPNDETFGDDRASVDAEQPKRGVTRLMKVAARGRSGELREMLADTSLDVNAVDSSGWTALMYAAQAGTLEAMVMLIDRRADVLKRSNEGETAMSAAVSSSTEPQPEHKVKVLWTAGLNINAADNRGVTPLMLAAERIELAGLVPAMMRLGADPTKRDVDGNTALDYLMAQVEGKQLMPPNFEVIRRALQASAAK